MKTCPNPQCRMTDISDDFKFCPKCGTALETTQNQDDKGTGYKVVVGLLFLLAVIGPIIVYFFIGWAAMDIYFNVRDVSDMTMIDVVRAKVVITTIVALLYIILILPHIKNATNDLSLAFIIPIVGVAVLQYFVPLSFGAGLVRVIFHVLTMIVASVILVKRKL